MNRVLTVKAFNDNYIWLILINNGQQENNVVATRTIIVDPGDARPVIQAIIDNSLEPAAIFVTHHHPDHIGGIRELLTRYPMPVYGPAGERINTVDRQLHDGDSITIEESLSFTIFDTPGHTLGHIAYYTQGMLFCGDTLFAGGCGRLFEGTPILMYQSLEKLSRLPDQTRIYCAHEYTLANLKFALLVEPNNPALLQRMADTEQLRARNQATVPSLLGEERQTNPFLRCRIPAVKHAAEHYSGKILDEPQDVFAVIRRWKDQQ